MWQISTQRLDQMPVTGHPTSLASSESPQREVRAA